MGDVGCLIHLPYCWGPAGMEVAREDNVCNILIE